jgi:hypothetical protein
MIKVNSYFVYSTTLYNLETNDIKYVHSSVKKYM